MMLCLCKELFVVNDDQTQPQTAAVGSSAAARTASTVPADTGGPCDVCFVAARNSRVALVPYGHQRFCESSANAGAVHDRLKNRFSFLSREF